ncbi:hypothetical protein LTR09_005787 [Extremus antarcticus]|uniref:Zn(2)-C6 fungal-type domain-containing protein n=1 Tax=Extremus antarcticus TaxID=702011 RepID=A0AAJ0DG33_9PEZI|nr:hypothetical protein LTR09_005787 [Extremus antarcticus]
MLTSGAMNDAVVSNGDADPFVVQSNTPPEQMIDGEQARKKPPKRDTVTRNACFDCRRSKCKCNGDRPVCGRCARRQTQCTYDVPEDGITKMQQLAQQLKDVDDNCALLSGFFDVLQTIPDELAFALLARIRIGESTEDIMKSLGREVLSAPSSLERMPSLEEELAYEPREVSEWFPAADTGERWSSWSQRCEESEQSNAAPTSTPADEPDLREETSTASPSR